MLDKFKKASKEITEVQKTINKFSEIVIGSGRLAKYRAENGKVVVGKLIANVGGVYAIQDFEVKEPTKKQKFLSLFPAV